MLRRRPARWRPLLEKVEAALTDLGLRTLALRGGVPLSLPACPCALAVAEARGLEVAEQQRTIDAFAAGADAAALLLAIEDDDSGLNLTCNHLPLFHSFLS